MSASSRGTTWEDWAMSCLFMACMMGVVVGVLWVCFCLSVRRFQ